MTTNRVVRSAAAGTVLLGGVLGLPYVLLAYIGNPIPAKTPSVSRIVWWLRSGQFDDRAAVVVLAYVLWACWAIFAVEVAAQLPGAIRAAVQARHGGRMETGRTRSLVGGGAVQVLLAALLVTLFAPRSALAATSSGPIGASDSMGARSAAVSVPVPGVGTSEGQRAIVRVHVVEHDENLWDIAAAYLGDPNRWSEIYEQNVGVAQPDGQVLTNPDVILPGWKLAMPSAVDAVAPSPADLPSQLPQLGEVAPHDAEPVSTPLAAAPREAPQTSAESHRAPRSAMPQHALAAPRDRVAVSLGADGYVGIGLASGIAAALAAGRLRRRARARAQFPIPLGDVPADRAAEVVAELERAHLLTLAPPDHGYVQDEDDPYLTEWVVEEPPVPLDRCSDGYGLPILKGTAEQEVARTRKALEAPTELSWGTGPRGDSVLLAVDASSGCGLSFEGEGAESALRALIVAASAAEGVPDCGTATRVVTTTAVAERVFGTTDLLDVARVEIKPDLSDALNDVEDEISERRTMLRSLGLRNAADVRRFKPDHLMQPLLLVTLPPAPTDNVRLTDVIEAGHALDVHAMVLGPPPEGSDVQVDADGTSRADGSAPGFDGTRAFHMSVAAAREALGVVFQATAAAHDREKTSAPDHVVPSPRAAAEAHVTQTSPRPDPPVRIEVFDGLGVVVNGCDISGRFRPRLRTLLSYLAVNPVGAPREYLLQEVFALEVTTKTRHKFSTELSEIRRALRAVAPDLIDATFIDDDPRTQRLRFEPSTITTDLTMFTQSLAAANTAEPTAQVEHLTEAVRLYRGPVLPIMEADWVEPVREQQRRRALDAYHRLAQLVGPSDAAYAIHLLENAIDVDRYNVETYQCLMRAQAAVGDTTGVRRTFELLSIHMEDLDEDTDQESCDLYSQLVGETL
ncbi:DNA-binding SARP family transcriptional activator [Catenulispora sp. MAP5-51]|uniref:BTAD domain-containing putative transcriptional regulator n=1 Tax=Catenulispora sp. MAP5-51 TaxID=3156298 RepID=UPI003512704D